MLIEKAEDLREVIRIMRAYKVEKLVLDGAEIVLSPVALLPKEALVPRKPAKPAFESKDPDNPDLKKMREELNGEEMDEDIMFHSSSGGGPAKGRPAGMLMPEIG